MPTRLAVLRDSIHCHSIVLFVCVVLGFAVQYTVPAGFPRLLRHLLLSVCDLHLTAVTSFLAAIGTDNAGTAKTAVPIGTAKGAVTKIGG